MPSISNMIATYTCNGNMTTRTVNGVTYAQAFDVENRLTSVTVNGQVTSFHYDADGNRTLTVQPNGTKVYTPFPDYEEAVPASGGATKRVAFSLAGQLIAVRVITDTTNNYYYAYADHLGSITGWSGAAGVYLSNSIALHEPFGAYRFRPPASVNPGISDRGFTGHRKKSPISTSIPPPLQPQEKSDDGRRQG